MSKQKKIRVFSNILFALRWQFRLIPWYIIVRFVHLIFGNVVTLFEHTFLLAYIISCVEKGKTLIDVLLFLIPVAIAVSIKMVAGPLIEAYLTPKANSKFYMHTRLLLYKKAAQLEIAKYDDTAFYNDFVWAMHRAPEKIFQATNTFMYLVSMVITALIAGTYIVTTDATALVVVIGIMISTLLLQHCITKRNMKREEELMPISRKRDYTNRVFYLANFVKDIKTGAIADKLKRDFTDTSEEMERVSVKHGKAIMWLAVARDGISALAFDGAYLIYLFYQALVKGKYGLGSLLAIYNAANRLSGNIRRAIMMLPQFEEQSLYIEKMRTFLKTENKMLDDGTLPLPLQGELVLEHVTFTYPGNDTPTIRDVSMRIKQGEKIALVGFNGAGKSTLIKLILRLYDPDSGMIKLGDNAVCEYPIDDYRRHFGALFQSFEIIATSLGENLTMSDTPLNKDKADTVMKKAAFWEKLSTLAEGYDTPLTKEFNDNGINLSGGEAQKIALARVLYADAGILILDEPSSALDPIAEYQLNKTVTELAKNKTVIIISHRLSTTRFVDKIYMLEDGHIIEQGDHDTLLAQDGKYAEMFRLQAEKYR